ncbi:MAG: 3'-5' exonuclease [Clostridium sp.]
MAFVIFDLEFNNLNGITTYYPDFIEEYGDVNNFELRNEIIEIGAIKLDAYMKPLKQMKVYIKPSVLPVLNPKITEITSITDDDLEQGVSFEEGMDMLNDLVDEGDVICSWAKDDIAEITQNAVYHEYGNFKLLKKYLDIQEYAMKIYGYKKSVSLKEVLTKAQIKVDKNKLHDALNDAIYTAEVLKRIYNSRALNGCIRTDIFHMPMFGIDEEDIEDLDFEQVKLLCPKCKLPIEIEEEFRYIGWRFLALGECKKCKNRIKAEVSLKRTLADEIVYNEIETIIKEEEYSRIQHRMNK